MSPLRAITLALWSNIMGQGSRISTRKQIVNLNCLIIFTRWRWKQYLNCRKKITEPHEIQSLQNLQNGWNAIGNAWVHSCSQGREFDLHWPRLTKPTCNAIKKGVPPLKPQDRSDPNTTSGFVFTTLLSPFQGIRRHVDNMAHAAILLNPCAPSSPHANTPAVITWNKMDTTRSNLALLSLFVLRFWRLAQKREIHG